MEFKSQKVWISAKDEMESKAFIKKKAIPFYIIFFAIIIAIFCIAWYQAYLMDISGHTITDFSLGIWTFVIFIGAVFVNLLFIANKFKDCGDYKEVTMLLGVFATSGALLVLHGIAHGIWFAMQISGTSGDLYTILVLEVIIQFLIAFIGFLVVVAMTNVMRRSKRECETILYGMNLSPQFFSGEDINAKIRCKRKDNTVMCEVPKISSLD